jgi:thioredoxin 2
MSSPVHIVCPACSSRNRVPRERLGDSARCGKCKDSLFPGRPLDLNGQTFGRHVEGSDIPLVVDFWAPWCAPCRMMEPAFKEAAARLEPRARLAKVNTDKEQALAGSFGIKGIPTTVVFKGGREVDRKSGALDGASLLSWIESFLG